MDVAAGSAAEDLAIRAWVETTRTDVSHAITVARRSSIESTSEPVRKWI